MRTATVTRLYSVPDALIVVREYVASLDAMGDRELLSELAHPFFEEVFFGPSPRILSMQADKATEAMRTLVRYCGLPLTLR